jgi:hypothetical protein
MALDNARAVLPMVTASPPPPLTCERMGMLTRPTLVMKGANTQPWYSMMAEALDRCVPDGRLTVIPGSKHDGPVRNAPDVGRVLMGFLDSH